MLHFSIKYFEPEENALPSCWCQKSKIGCLDVPRDTKRVGRNAASVGDQLSTDDNFFFSVMFKSEASEVTKGNEKFSLF
jgi:hypothetical protein